MSTRSLIITALLVMIGEAIADAYLHQHVLISYFLGIGIAITRDIIVGGILNEQ